MSILQALVRAYDRLPDAPPIGYSMEKISFVIPLAVDGTPRTPIDVRTQHKTKMLPKLSLVPQPAKRASGVVPNFLWDKTQYVLGIGTSKRLVAEHAAFCEFHRVSLEGTDDAGLRAMLAFLEQWTPEAFETRAWSMDIVDTNIAFALEDEWVRAPRLLHERSAAREIWLALRDAREATSRVCLVTGQQAPPARLHTAIKGVWNAQSFGASIVAFNQRSFESYGHTQGENAPISESAAFKYTTVLNRFLAPGSGHRVQIGDASCVFWADSTDETASEDAELLMGGMFAGGIEVDDARQAEKVGSILERIRRGVPLREAAPQLEQGVRFHVLGLAPNAARLSIRFWMEDDLGVLIRRYQRFIADLAIEPGDRDPVPTLWKYLAETAVLGKRENVPPKLAGDWMHAILTGNRYPLTLLTTVLMRIRADKNVNARRAAMLRAVLVRNFRMDQEAPVSLDPENRSRGYRLGRLFAVYEHIQRAALGRNVNATIKDKYYGSASTRPGSVFPILDKASTHHLAKLRKVKPGAHVNLERTLRSVMDTLSPAENPFANTLPLAEQALFTLGYHHQFAAGLAPASTAPTQPDTETSA